MWRETIKPKSHHWRARRYRKTACEECQATENLQGHHLDGNPANNTPENVMTLCGSCHTKWHWRNGKQKPMERATCQVCGEPAKGHRLCGLHYQRWKRLGRPKIIPTTEGFLRPSQRPTTP